ncbi:MAG: response regulator receiver protein [Cycloclasticus sp.]|nr:MAG: response regulator receiver protein [Cycloclasticus sp.]
MALTLQKKGFSKQLNVAFLINITLLSIVSAAFIAYVTYERERDAYIDYGINISNALVKQLSALSSGNTEQLIRDSFKTFSTLSGVQQLVVFDDEFRPTLTLNKNQDFPIIKGWQDIASNQVKFEREANEGLYFTVNLENLNFPSSTAFLMIVLEKQSVATYIQSIFVTNVGIIAFIAMILLIAVSLVIRRLSKPLEAFSSMMIQAASGSTGLRTHHDASAELFNMSEAFNQMMEVIEARHDELEISRDRALQTAKIKSDFASNVSHEIRTPLNGILGMVNLLKEMGLPQHQQEYLEVASKSGDALLQMVNDVLDFSKMESGRFQLEIKDVDLTRLLEQESLLFASRAQSKNLELCLDLPTDQIYIIQSDPTRLRQVVSNVLNNAIKFTSDGHVTLSAKIQVTEKNASFVEISISDTGIGIPEKSLDKIFAPFSQVDAKIANDYGGTGLGLTIVKRMVELMGGSVSVTSTLDEGSCFKIILPVDVQTIKFERPDIETELLKGKNILLVEPFEETSNYMERVFQNWGMHCQTVQTFDQAVSSMDVESTAKHAADMCFFNVDYCEGNFRNFLDNFKVNKTYINTKLVPMTRFGSKLNPVDESEGSIFASIDRPIRREKLMMTLLDAFFVGEKPAKTKAIKPTYSGDFLRDMKALIVDDNSTNRFVAEAMLNELGVISNVAVNGQEAVDACKEHNYDFILMDCNMPVLDGFQATEVIRAFDTKYKQPIIIALTAKDKQSDLDNCLSCGMNDVLLKPFNLQDLLATLGKELGASSLENQTGSLTAQDVSGENPVIVDSVFSTLHKNTGDGIEKIVQSYLIDSPIYIVTLIAAMEAGDESKCMDLAHKLKGSSRNLGAEGLVSACVDIENTWEQAIVEESLIAPLVEKLELEFSLVELALTNKLAVLDISDSSHVTRQKEVVLVVDDDQSTRMTIVSVLEREGYQVEQGSNGREAVRLFEILRPNVVVMDAMMPIKNGFEACEEIKKMPGGQDVPVLITTALESEKSVDLAFRSGAADFVPKPINLSVLRQRVKRLLAKQVADKHVQKLAYKDSLTGLPNRAAFVERIQQDLDYAKRNNSKTAVFFVDLDQFKDINDSLGHEAGDILLKAMSGRLTNCIRSGDMLARLGGDEFVVIMNMQVGDTADQIADSMITAVRTPFNIAGNEIFASISIGISVYPEDGLTKDDLLKNADTAMYRAKAAGRNTYRKYTQKMSEVLEQRLRVENELRKVIDDNELSLYYQPKQDTKTGEVVGSEALVRWKHKLRGIVSPAEFIPVAEEMGLIKDIGLWVLDTACATIKNWQNEYDYQGTVAVNISAVQMADEKFVSLVASCLNKHKLDPKYLELEVTETMVLENIDAMLEKLNQIKKMGVSISIDDFGTGYSSFSYIKQMPASTLKLDMEFIADIPQNKGDMAVVDGMIVLAHNLGMKVVAEGVETKEQYDFLVEHDCDLIQGYYIDKPLPEEVFETSYVNLKEKSATSH